MLQIGGVLPSPAGSLSVHHLGKKEVRTNLPSSLRLRIFSARLLLLFFFRIKLLPFLIEVVGVASRFTRAADCVLIFVCFPFANFSSAEKIFLSSFPFGTTVPGRFGSISFRRAGFLKSVPMCWEVRFFSPLSAPLFALFSYSLWLLWVLKSQRFFLMIFYPSLLVFLLESTAENHANAFFTFILRRPISFYSPFFDQILYGPPGTFVPRLQSLFSVLVFRGGVGGLGHLFQPHSSPAVH